MAGKYDPKQGLIPFTIVAACASLLMFVYLYLGRQPVPEAEGFRQELAEWFGGAGGSALAVIYVRSILKLVLNEGSIMQRFIPGDYHERASSTARQILNFLNRTHRYVGAAAVGILFSHALLMGTARWNPFLYILLGLIAWQGLFGLFLVIRFPVVSLKRYSYLVHAQLFSGVLIGLCAAFGHLLASD